ncbi:MAG: ABC transporter permease [Thaumarchaeota archaeon]|nr:ABC transporter permease [Nitrososphaerota archaeon]
MSNGESKGVRRLGANTYRLILFTILIIVWQIISMSLGRMFLPTPSGVATAAVELFANGTIIEATLISLATFATGYLLAVALAIPMGLMMGGFKKVGEALDVYINAFNAMPRIALIPLIMIWFGLDFQAKVVIVLISAFFPIVINTYTGVLNVDKDLLEASRSFGAKDKDLFLRIMLPASVPFLMTGLRLGVARGIMGIIMAEFFMTAKGLGGLIVTYGSTFQMEKLFVAVTVLTVIGGVLAESVKRVEKLIAPWKTGTIHP